MQKKLLFSKARDEKIMYFSRQLNKKACIFSNFWQNNYPLMQSIPKKSTFQKSAMKKSCLSSHLQKKDASFANLK